MMKIFHLHLLFNTVHSVAEQREARNLTYAPQLSRNILHSNSIVK